MGYVVPPLPARPPPGWKGSLPDPQPDRVIVHGGGNPLVAVILFILALLALSGCTTLYCVARAIDGNTNTQLYERECRGRE